MNKFIEKYSDIICDYVIIVLAEFMILSMILWG